MNPYVAHLDHLLGYCAHMTNTAFAHLAEMEDGGLQATVRIMLGFTALVTELESTSGTRRVIELLARTGGGDPGSTDVQLQAPDATL